MDNLQLRDEAVRDRVRAAQEFLDPRMSIKTSFSSSANRPQSIPLRAATDQILY
jgi:hypothetical protein